MSDYYYWMEDEACVESSKSNSFPWKPGIIEASAMVRKTSWEARLSVMIKYHNHDGHILCGGCGNVPAPYVARRTDSSFVCFEDEQKFMQNAFHEESFFIHDTTFDKRGRWLLVNGLYVDNTNHFSDHFRYHVLYAQEHVLYTEFQYIRKNDLDAWCHFQLDLHSRMEKEKDAKTHSALWDLYYGIDGSTHPLRESYFPSIEDQEICAKSRRENFD